MEFELVEGLMVLTLFLGYLALWRLKKRKMLRHNGGDPEVIYYDNRPTQKFFANLSRVMSVFIALLIVLHSAGVKDDFGFYPIVFIDTVLTSLVSFWSHALPFVIALLS